MFDFTAALRIPCDTWACWRFTRGLVHIKKSPVATAKFSVHNCAWHIRDQVRSPSWSRLRASFSQIDALSGRFWLPSKAEMQAHVGNLIWDIHPYARGMCTRMDVTLGQMNASRVARTPPSSFGHVHERSGITATVVAMGSCSAQATHSALRGRTLASSIHVSKAPDLNGMRGGHGQTASRCGWSARMHTAGRSLAEPPRTAHGVARGSLRIRNAEVNVGANRPGWRRLHRALKAQTLLWRPASPYHDGIM